VTLRDAFTSCLVTGFSWHGKKKEKPTGLDTSTGFVPASLPTTDGVAEGVSRLWRNQIVTVQGLASPTV